MNEKGNRLIEHSIIRLDSVKADLLFSDEIEVKGKNESYLLLALSAIEQAKSFLSLIIEKDMK